MKAITIPTPGDADALVLDEVPTPEIAADEVLVQVAAAGVNRADLMQRQGFYPHRQVHRHTPASRSAARSAPSAAT